MNENLKKQKKVVIGKRDFLLQMVPATWYLEAVDECKDANGNTQTGKYMTKILQNVVVSPRMTIDDFTGQINTLKNLTKEANKFILGEDIEATEGATPEETEKNADMPEENKLNEDGFSGV